MRDRDAPECLCPHCNSAMKLIGAMPKLGGVPELLIYYCADCDALEHRDGARNPPPSMWR